MVVFDNILTFVLKKYDIKKKKLKFKKKLIQFEENICIWKQILKFHLTDEKDKICE